MSLPLELFDPTEFVVFLVVFAVLSAPVALLLVVAVRRVSPGEGGRSDGACADRGWDFEDP